MKNYLISIFLLYSITLSSQLMGGFMSPTHTVTDIDGNEYKTVKIGTQIWMAENLRTATYNNGTAIPNVTDGSAWRYLSTGAWCYYDNNSSYNIPYGKLYNWYAVNTGNLCPTGWHVPSFDEAATLINYSPTLANRGFNVFLGGARSGTGVFQYLDVFLGLWTNTEYNCETCNGDYSYRFFYEGGVFQSYYVAYNVIGYSVRCIKD